MLAEQATDPRHRADGALDEPLARSRFCAEVGVDGQPVQELAG